ncbi:hypothetical protein MBLNU230_g2666t1 [Neophaeotheca triangularis]
MRIPQTSMQRLKVGLHFFQGLLAAIGACMSLAVLVMEGSSDGRIGLYFAMCLLTIPALIYLTMVPLWTRARFFQNAYIYALIDISYAILWLASFAAVAAWNANGLSKGSKSSADNDDNDKEKRQEDGDEAASDDNDSETSGCDAFAFGSATKCQVSKAMIGFGVLLWLLFCLTSYLAIRGIIRYRETGELPGSKRGVHRPRQHQEARQTSLSSHAGDSDDEAGPASKEHDAWSTHTGDIEPPAPQNPYDSLRSHDSDRLPFPSAQTPSPPPPRVPSRANGANNLLHQQSTEYNPHPGRQLSYTGSENSGPRPSQRVPTPSYDPGVPSALSPGVYDPRDAMGRVSFPQGLYGSEFR